MSCEISVVYLDYPLFVGTAPQSSAAAPPAAINNNSFNTIDTMPYCVCILHAHDDMPLLFVLYVGL